MQEQEKTRLLLLSPEITQEKLRESIWLRILKEGDREAYNKMMSENQDRKNLATRVWSIKRENLKGVKIPGEMCARIGEQFLEDHKFLTGRNMRDISRLLGIIKGFAMLNYKHHQKENDYLIATEDDILTGFKLYYAVSVPNELGLSPEMWNIFFKCRSFIESKEDLGMCRKDFQRWYYQTFFKTLGRQRADDIIKTWETVGLITEAIYVEGMDRRVTYYVLGTIDEQNNVSRDTGTAKVVPTLNNTLFSEENHSEGESNYD
jgi:hypothetical protein